MSKFWYKTRVGGGLYLVGVGVLGSALLAGLTTLFWSARVITAFTYVYLLLGAPLTIAGILLLFFSEEQFAEDSVFSLACWFYYAGLVIYLISSFPDLGMKPDRLLLSYTVSGLGCAVYVLQDKLSEARSKLYFFENRDTFPKY